MLCIKAVEHIVRLSTTEEYVVPLAFEYVVKLTVIAVTLLLSFATAAQLCYHCSALLPLVSFATAGQLRNAKLRATRQSKLSCLTLPSAAQHCSAMHDNTQQSATMLSNARQYSAICNNTQQSCTVQGNVYSARLSASEASLNLSREVSSQKDEYVQNPPV